MYVYIFREVPNQYLSNLISSIGLDTGSFLVSRLFGIVSRDRGSISSRVIPKTHKIVLYAALLNT